MAFGIRMSSSHSDDTVFLLTGLIIDFPDFSATSASVFVCTLKLSLSGPADTICNTSKEEGSETKQELNNIEEPSMTIH